MTDIPATIRNRYSHVEFIASGDLVGSETVAELTGSVNVDGEVIATPAVSAIGSWSPGVGRRAKIVVLVTAMVEEDE